MSLSTTPLKFAPAHLFDLLLALVMGSYAFYESWVSQVWRGPVAINTIVVTTSTLFLAFRRTLPFLVLLMVGAAIVGLGIAYGSTQAWSSIFPFVVVVYSAAAYSANVAYVMVTVLIIVVLRDANDPNVHSIADALFSSTLALLSIMAGLEGRRIQHRTLQLDLRAEELELEEAQVAQEAASNERRRIARELHDIISHNLGIVVLQAGAASQVIESNPQQAKDALQSIRRIGQEAISELGGLLGLVREGAEPSLEPQPTLSDIPEMVARAKSAGMQVELSLAPSEIRLSPALELSAFRIVQEGLTNAQKYAKNAHVVICIEIQNLELRISIVDDGPANVKNVGGRRGLAGMAERVAVFGGKFRAGPGDDAGWSIIASMPITR